MVSKLSKCLRKNGLDIKRTRFASIDRCSTMASKHVNVKQLLKTATYHFMYIHCISHQLALCFAHLMLSLLLNLCLLLRNSSVKQSTFEEVHQACNLLFLKLIKAAMTCWLYHGQAGKSVLERYETPMASLNKIYFRKHEPDVETWRCFDKT